MYSFFPWSNWWLVMILLAGMPMKRLGIVMGGGLFLLTATYFLYDNARHRIDSFFGGGVPSRSNVKFISFW